MNSSPFGHDPYLSPLADTLNRYDLISLDLFDTLLLRACACPEDIFERTGQRLKTEGLSEYAPETYRALRVEAERRARQMRGGGEVTFEQIYDQMPEQIAPRQSMMRYELEAEAEALYLNPNMDGFVRHCKSLGKRVAAVSNMYLSQAQILRLLRGVGFDPALLDGCFVSAAYGTGKREGLFALMLSQFPDLDPSRAVHIGDSAQADVQSARQAGMHAVHYTLTARRFADLYEIETKRYGSNLGMITSLRQLAAHTRPNAQDDQEAFFHTLGAEVFGPVYALFAEWIVDLAKRRHVQVILPFMREGERIAKMVNAVLVRRGISLTCVPWSISRHPAFAASIDADTLPDKLHDLAYKSNCTLGSLFAELGLSIQHTPYAHRAEQTTMQLRKDGQCEALLRELEGAFREEILAYAQTQRESLLALLTQLTGGLPALTVDLGTRASTAGYLDDILTNAGREPLSHALLLGADAKNVENLLGGMRLYAWLGLAGENSAKITRLIYPLTVLEALLNATCGTVLRYQTGPDGVFCVLDDKTADAREERLLLALWEGMDTFQRLWLDLDRQKHLKDKLTAMPEDFLNILVRFIDMPTQAEAAHVGMIRYYDALTARKPVALCTPADPGLSPDQIDALLSASAWGNSVWPQAAVAQTHPDYFLNRYLRESATDPFIQRCHRILADCRARGFTRVAVYALNENARVFERIARSMGAPIAGFVDSNPQLHGSVVAGIRVESLSALGARVDAYVIASFYSADEIRAAIEAHYAGCAHKPVIYDFSGTAG